MRIAMILAAAALALATVACGDSGTETTVRTPAAPSGETANTGIPSLDYTLNSALRADRIELAGLTGYQSIPCVETSQGAGSAPVCRENETPGDPVEVFPVLQCELIWTRPEVVPDAYQQALGEAPSLFALYRPVPQPLVLDADYVAVFDTDPGDVQSGIALTLREGRVIAMEYDCGNFAGLYAPDKVQEFVVQPGGATPPQ
ncbi:MAG TPA: hypothetical protein VFH62_03370 [Dehalococcoidia bacterium]|jgi:hypothetical protein|nr:hypothetical protein [Dehalococcoidia bacterium]